MALSQPGNALGISILMTGDTFAVGRLLSLPGVKLIEDGSGDGGDEAFAAGDGALEMRVHLVRLFEKHEYGLAEVFAAAGLDETDGEIGTEGQIPGGRQDFGNAAGDFGVGVGEVVEEGGEGGIAERGEFFLGGVSGAEVGSSKAGNEVGHRGLCRGGGGCRRGGRRGEDR